MKRLISLIMAFFIFPAVVLVAYADSSAYIESDGIVNVYEWENCDRTTLFEGYEISDSCYHSVRVRYRYISRDRRLYFAVTAENGNSELSKVPENNYTELYFSFDKSSRITVCSDARATYNEDEFFLRYGSKSDSFGGVSYEVETLLKDSEYGDNLTMYIQMKDYNGNLTQLFEIKIKSEELKEKESESLAQSEKLSEKESKAKAKKSGTTKQKTTTGKETTTEIETAIITEKYVPYSQELKKNNRTTVVISAACLLTSVAAMCISVFKKDKKK